MQPLMSLKGLSTYLCTYLHCAKGNSLGSQDTDTIMSGKIIPYYATETGICDFWKSCMVDITLDRFMCFDIKMSQIRGVSVI